MDVINTLVSLHSYELNPSTAITRDNLSLLYDLDRNKYNEYLYSFMSLPGNVVIQTEKDIEASLKRTCCKDYFGEKNINYLLDKVNKTCYKKTGHEVDMLVVDNINCIRSWDGKAGEYAYTCASNYFRKVALSFGNTDEYKGKVYGGKPVICLLLSQINRTGGKAAEELGFYPDSCIAETVNIERDATTIIPIYTNQYLIESNVAFIKLEASRYSKAMTTQAEVPIYLEYGKIGTPIGQINVDDNKKKMLLLLKDYRVVDVVDESYHRFKILLKKGCELPVGLRQIDDDEIIDNEDEGE
jgi:hypothetical protein